MVIRLKHAMLYAIGTAVVLTLVVLAAVFLLQRSLLFPRPVPPNGAVMRATRIHAETVTLRDGSALFLAPLMSRRTPAPLLIFMHGNAELVDDWVDQFDEPRREGWAVLLLEYPGYGRIPGSPSQKSIVASALAAYDWAARDPRIDATRIVPFGRSLGSGPAVQIAVQRRVPALILESSFTSVRALASQLYVPGLLLRDPFDNLTAIARFRGPLLVRHGMADQVVPVSHGRALAAAVPGAELMTMACGHNDCPRAWPEVIRWLERHMTTRG